MTYDLADVNLYKVEGAVKTGIDVSVAGLTVTSGFSEDSSGALSLEPDTASARMSVRSSVTDIATYATAPLEVGDRIDVEYDTVTIFQGSVANVQVTVEVGTSPDKLYVCTYSYTLRGVSGLMMDYVVQWTSLPEEDPLERLRTWFSVDVSSLSAPQLAYISAITLEAEDEGEATYLELARKFSEATSIPLRAQSEYPDRWDSVEVVDTAIAWNATPPTPVLTDADEWSTSVDFESSGGELKPTALSVKEDDTRFLGGFKAITGYVSTPLGSFVLGTSLLGTQPAMSVGFQSGSAVDVFGTTMVVSRIVHSFGKTYRAGLELSAPVVLNV